MSSIILVYLQYFLGHPAHVVRIPTIYRTILRMFIIAIREENLNHSNRVDMSSIDSQELLKPSYIRLNDDVLHAKTTGFVSFSCFPSALIYWVKCARSSTSQTIWGHRRSASLRWFAVVSCSNPLMAVYSFCTWRFFARCSRICSSSAINISFSPLLSHTIRAVIIFLLVKVVASEMAETLS